MQDALLERQARRTDKEELLKRVEQNRKALNFRSNLLTA